MEESLLIKICGMREPDNILALSALEPDFIGFIFYPGSPRYAGDSINEIRSVICSSPAKKVGVFVNEPIEQVKRITEILALDRIQLHGDESPSYCQALHNDGLKIIRAFRMHAEFDFRQTEAYAPSCRMFLFDTASASFGGSGEKFDWNILQHYAGEVPFLLGGGISPEDAEKIKSFVHPAFAGIDLNSRFEKSPGVKDIALLENFIRQIKSQGE
ncbi:MAG: phosphoribosylanthranilate isomerase [Bacteroidales bacterium]